MSNNYLDQEHLRCIIMWPEEQYVHICVENNNLNIFYRLYILYSALCWRYIIIALIINEQITLSVRSIV